MKPYYDHGGITIYHGDCRDILKTITKCGLLLTDPPYVIGWTRGVNNQRASKSHIGIQNDQDTSCRDEVIAILGESQKGIVFGSFYAPFPSNLKQVLVWHKPADYGLVGSVTGFRRDAEPIFLIGSWPTLTVRWSSVVRTCHGMSSITSATGHPHTKPTDLIENLIHNSEASRILDPFMGSGSTLVAAKNMGCESIGIEVEERYCEIAAKRLAQEVLF